MPVVRFPRGCAAGPARGPGYGSGHDLNHGMQQEQVGAVMLLVKTGSLSLTAASLGTAAGLWDLTSLEMSWGGLVGTLLILAIAGFALAALAPRGWGGWVLLIALGVLLSHLMATTPHSGLPKVNLSTGLVAAAVALVPASLGAVIALGILWMAGLRRSGSESGRETRTAP